MTFDDTIGVLNQSIVYCLLLKCLNKDGTNLAPYLGLVVSKRRDVLECVNNVNK